MVWISFWAAISASRMPRLLRARQCPLGHAVEHQHQFCPTCGASLPDDPAAYVKRVNALLV